MKTLNTVLMALLLGGMLTACGGGADTPAQDAPAEPQEEVDTEAMMEQEKFQNMIKSFEEPDRERWQQPDVVVGSLGDLTGKTVADIGAGSGYFTYKLAKTAAKVLAIDVDQRFIDHLNQRSEKDGATNVETRLTTPESPGLEPGEADVVLCVNTFHLIEDPIAWLDQVRDGMAENSLLVIVDYNKFGYIPQGPDSDAKLEPEEVEAYMQEAGFDRVKADKETLKHQYIVKTVVGSFD